MLSRTRSETHVLNWSSAWLALLASLAYLAPGWALSICFELRGVRWFGRWLFRLVLSLVIVPFVLLCVSAFIHVELSMLTAGGLAAVFLAAALCLRLLGRPIRIVVKDRTSGAAVVGRREQLLAAGAILLFAMLVTLPRLHYLGAGTPGFAAQWDDYWHLARITAVAESGLPPVHPFFPEWPLRYYYAAWIYPALLVRILGGFSVPASLALYGFWITVACAGVSYSLICLNCRTRLGKILGLLFVTLAGGFDLFFAPEMSLLHWWQSFLPGLSSTVLIEDSYYNALWVPQHLSGLLCFGVVLLLWRNVRAPTLPRAAAFGVMMSYMFASSAFVFLSALTAGIALAWIVRRRMLGVAGGLLGGTRWLTLRWRRGLAAGIIGLGLFGVGSFRMVVTTAGQLSVVHWSRFRILLLERMLVSHGALGEAVDRILTIVALPVPTIAILSIELGLAFMLFLAWLWTRPWSRSPVWHGFLALYPALYLPLVFLLGDDGNNLASRGMMPVALCIFLGASLLPEALAHHNLSKREKVAWGYLLAVVLLGSMVTPLAEIDYYGRPAIGAAVPLPAAVVRFVPPKDALPKPLEYISWANQSTPVNSLFVEPNALVVDRRFWMLERMRYLGPESVPALRQADPAVDFHLPHEVIAGAALTPETLIEESLASHYVAAAHPSVYLIWRGTPPPPVEGVLVYQDATVTIYRLLGNAPSQ